MHFSFKIFMALLDVALNIYERYVEVKLLIEYWECGDTNWFWLTVACILLPGVIIAAGVTMASIKVCECDDVLFAALLLVFPIISLIW